MTDNEPLRPRGALVGGHLVVGIGWIICALAVGLVVLQLALGTLSVGGIVMAVLVAAAGGTAIAVGHSLERSRER